jgi:hypothetical protein
MALLFQGSPVAGTIDIAAVSEKVPPRLVRRLKKLPRMTLSLAVGAHENSKLADPPAAVFMGTGWGALSETYDFLAGLNESQERFPSPTDFVGSVHNGPAGQAAIMFGATGANITMSGGDYSFEQALLAAELMFEDTDQNALVIGADEGHQPLSPLLDQSIAPERSLAEGGGALCLSRKKEHAACFVRIPFYKRYTREEGIDSLLESLGGTRNLQDKYALLMAGIPAAAKEEGERQLACFLRQSGLKTGVVRYRAFTGEFASASAVAAVTAVSCVVSGMVPGKLAAGEDIVLKGMNSAILVLGLGRYLTAMEFFRP